MRPVLTHLGPEKHPVKVMEGTLPVPEHLPLVVLHEVPGLVAWVGRQDDKGRVRDAAPIFIQDAVHPKPLTALRAGIVLLCDLARDFTVENRLASTNFTLGNADRLETHVTETYGAMTLQYLQREFVGGQALGTANARYIAKRLTRILRVNYPELRFDAMTDKARIILRNPFTLLVRINSNARFKTLLALSTALGEAWLEAESSLLRKRPDLADRSRFFGDAAESPAA